MAVPKTGEAAISDEAVRTATGRHRQEWFRLLDAWGAAAKGHKETAKHLSEAHGVPAWWAQTVTVEYERARGLRAVGETSKGYAASVQRTMDGDPDAVWEHLLSNAPHWLGAGGTLEEGRRVTTRHGEAEVRAVRPGRLLRLHFLDGAAGKEVLDVTLAGKGDRTTVRFQHERLPDADARDEAKRQWLEELARLQA